MGLSWTFGLTFYIIAPKTSKNIHVWISSSQPLLLSFMGHREPVGHQQIQSTSWLTSISKSTSDPLYFPHFPIQQASNQRFTQPSQPLPPTSNLKSLANCWPRQLSLQRSLWSSDILNTHGFFRGDMELRWAPWRPFFHKGAELRRTSMDRLA